MLEAKASCYLRGLQWTMEAYFWLCERKRSKLSFAERARFEDAEKAWRPR